jgi:hypothetical protein
MNTVIFSIFAGQTNNQKTKAMSKKTVKPAEKTISNAGEQPKKLSKIGEFMRKYPNGVGEILDMKAVMK